MLFILLNTLAGITLIVLPIYLWRRFKTEWEMPKWFFLKVGLLSIVVQVFAFSVFDSLLSYFPQYMNAEMLWQAIFAGIFTGLFFELGRFYILDKIFPKVRGFKSAVFFGFSWGGLSMFIVGIALLFASIGLYMLIGTDDVSTLIPEATPEQIEQLQVLKNAATGGVIETISAIIPIFERVSFILFDVLLSLIIVFGLMQKRPSYVWISVGLRTIISALMFFVAPQNAPVGLLFFVSISAGCVYGIKRLKPSLSI